MAYLINNDVQETLTLAYREQRLGLVHAHRRAKTPVELDDHGLLQSCCSILLADDGIAEHARIDKRLNGVLGNETADALLQLAVVVGEDIDGLLRDASSHHLVLGKFQTRLAHTQILGRVLSVRLRCWSPRLLLPRWWRGSRGPSSLQARAQFGVLALGRGSIARVGMVAPLVTVF